MQRLLARSSKSVEVNLKNRQNQTVYIQIKYFKKSMEKQTPSKVLHRLIIIVSIIFLAGLLIFFLKDKTVGGAILVGGVIGLIIGVIGYFKIKKDDPIGATNLLSLFYVLGGIVMLSLGFAVFIFQRESFKDVIYEVGLGIVFLVYGIYLFKRKKENNGKSF